jgi:excisionase family DNA binding protein
VPKTLTRAQTRDPAYLTPTQVAEQLSVREEQVLRWMRAGWLDFQPLPRGRRITREALDRFLAEHPWED